MTTTTCCVPTETMAVPSLPDQNTRCPSEAWDAASRDAGAVKAAVHEKYSQIAAGGDSCGYSMIGDAYGDVDGYVAEADLGLGCGLPVEHAGLNPGQTVLDLGSGAGLDAFVARQVIGDRGEIIGLDFSEAMVAKARSNAQRLGFRNVRFALGDIEQMPLPSASVDVVISNCVLNLVPDKRRAFEEVYRVLRSGGHFAISDVVLTGPLPDALRRSVEAYVGCVAGAMERDAYLHLIRAAGFGAVQVVVERRIAAAAALSITVRGEKP